MHVMKSSLKHFVKTQIAIFDNLKSLNSKHIWQDSFVKSKLWETW